MDKNVWISIKGFTIFRVWIYNYLKNSTNCDDQIFSFFTQSLTRTLQKSTIGRNNVRYIFVIRNFLITKKTCANRKGLHIYPIKCHFHKFFLTHYIDLVVGISFWKILSEVYKLMIKDYVIEYLEETFNFLNYFADNIDIFKLKDKNICHF